MYQSIIACTGIWSKLSVIPLVLFTALKES